MRTTGESMMCGMPFMLTIARAYPNLMGNITRSKRARRNKILFGGAPIERWVSAKFRCCPLSREAEPNFLATLLLSVNPFRFKDDGNPIGTVYQGYKRLFASYLSRYRWTQLLADYRNYSLKSTPRDWVAKTGSSGTPSTTWSARAVSARPKHPIVNRSHRRTRATTISIASLLLRGIRHSDRFQPKR